MSETSMWLFPVVLFAVLSLGMSFKIGIRWTWGLAIQHVLILIASSLGFFFLYAPPAMLGGLNGAQMGALCAWAAWAMFGVFTVGQRILLNKVALDVSLLRVNDAVKRARFLKLISWGPPGDYWVAVTDMLAMYSDGRTNEADEQVARWRADDRIPPQAREGLLMYALLGRVLRHDWDFIIDEFTASQRGGRPQGSVPFQLAARAFAERHRYTESLACLEMTNATAGRLSANAVDMNFLPFFALSGAYPQLERLLANCTDKTATPEFARLFWLGRCAAVQGDTTKAIALLQEAKSKTPPTLASWHDRLDRQIGIQQAVLDGGESLAEPAAQPLIDHAYRVYARSRLTADIVRPAGVKPGLMILMVSIVVAYIIASPISIALLFHAVDWMRSNTPELTEQLSRWQIACLEWGQLDQNLWHGQWWRLLTYMFMHGNTAHLLLNTGALYLFGKTVENMYGTPRFYVIYFLSGILSGVLQLVAIPWEPAVGASGAILGIFGAAIAGIVKLKNFLPPQIRRTELRWMLSIAGAQVVFDQLVNNIANMTDKSNQGIRIAAFAHAGGIVAGFVLGMVLPLRRWKELDTVDMNQNRG